jgi:hypothetical protein
MRSDEIAAGHLKGLLSSKELFSPFSEPEK